MNIWVGTCVVSDPGDYIAMEQKGARVILLGALLGVSGSSPSYLPGGGGGIK